MNAATASTPPDLFEAAKRLCAARGIEALDLLEELQRNLAALVPAGCRIARCGCCQRSSVVPTGDALRELRTDTGFTQAEVAQRAMVAPQTISLIETNRRDATDPVVRAYQALAEERASG